MTIPYTITPEGIFFVFKGKPENRLKSDPDYQLIYEAIINDEETKLEETLNRKNRILLATKGRVVIYEGEVLFDYKPVPDYLGQRILEHLGANLPIDSLCKMTEKLMQNPNLDVRQDLFKWLEKGQMPIFEDGDILGYKIILSNFTSVHRNKEGINISHAIGTEVSMPREDCDGDRNRTCSSGLHFCSLSYLPKYGTVSNKDTHRIVIVKIDPVDVVAIPKDYNQAKARCCRYTVVNEVDYNQLEQKIHGVFVYGEQTIKEGEYEPSRTEPDLIDDKFTPSVEQSLPEDDEDSWSEEEDSWSEDLDDDEAFYHTATNQYWWPSELQKIFEEVGSVSKVAKEIGVPRTTVGRWFKKMK